jgi:hypothetical protein
MSLQLGAALREGIERFTCRTGALLLAAYAAFMAALIPISNTMIGRIYANIGLSEVADELPLVLDIPLPVAVGAYFVGLLAGTYLSLVSIRTFVAAVDDSFPDGALTRNIPLAMINVLVGGIVYMLLVAIGSVLFIIPGVIAYLAFLFMLPYIAVEDRNFIDALQASYRLSKGNWLLLFALLVIVTGVGGLLGAIGSIVFSIALGPSLGQISIVIVQAPVTLYLFAVLASAFRQLRDGAGAGEMSAL